MKPFHVLLFIAVVASLATARAISQDERTSGVYRIESEVPRRLRGGMTTLGPYDQGQLRAVSYPTKILTSGIRRRVPQDFPTIQGAINACADGDTVLIAEGTYFENIRYHGKAIVVASLFITDGDTTHIEKTIIDGSRPVHTDSGSVVYFKNGEDTTSVLCGLTIQGGSGTRWKSTSGPDFWCGGGVLCYSAGAKLVRNIITRNRVIGPGACGGGIEVDGGATYLPRFVLRENRIVANSCRQTVSSPDLAGYGGGVDIWGAKVQIVGNLIERDTVASVTGARGGGLLVSQFGDVLRPEGQIISNVFRSNVAHSTSGAETGGGAFHGGVLLLITGPVRIEGNLFANNIAVCDSAPHAIAFGGGLTIADGYANPVRKVVVNNRFEGNVVRANTLPRGAGLRLVNTDVLVSGNAFIRNSAEDGSEVNGGGGGIFVEGSSFRVENNLFLGNASCKDGGGMLIWGEPSGLIEQTIINNTFLNNRAADHGSGVYSLGTHHVFLNNIFWDDTTAGRSECFFFNQPLALAYCDMKGGHPGLQNIDAPPAFVGGDSSFHLTSSSPCVEAGIDSVQFAGRWYLAPNTDLSRQGRAMPTGSRPDIGAQEEQTTGIAYALSSTVDRPLARRLLDTVTVRARVRNPGHHALGIKACTRDFATGNLMDSLMLYNDGLHGDGMPDDSLWGGRFIPAGAGVYGFGITTVDATAGTTRSFADVVPAFTTAGPVKLIRTRRASGIGDEESCPGADLWWHVGLRNTGITGLIPAVTVDVSAVDPHIDWASMQSFTIGNLSPADTATYSTNPVEFLLGADRLAGSVARFALQIASGGTTFWHDTVRIVITAVEEPRSDRLPSAFSLSQNYPNPFNPVTVIRYALPSRSFISLSVFNTLGQKVAVVQEGEREAGSHETRFDAMSLPSGVYFYRLQAGTYTETKKLLLVR